MSVLLHTHFNVHAKSHEEVDAVFPNDLALQITHFPGLQFKIWGSRNQGQIGSGFYLFKTEADALAWKKEVTEYLSAQPIFSDIEVDIYHIDESKSRITKAPLDLPANPSINA